jgi:hypothetical protein
MFDSFMDLFKAFSGNLLINITMESGGGEGAGQLAYWPQQIS